IEKITLKVNRYIDFSHTRAIVISEAAAKDSLADILVFLERFANINRRSQILIARGNTDDITNLKTEMERASSYYIDSLFENQNSRGLFVHQDVYDFIKMMHSTSGNMLISTVSSENKNVDIGGAAVIKHNKLVGWLNPEETLGINLVLNNVNNVYLSNYEPTLECMVTFKLKKSKSKISLSSNGTIPSLTIKLEAYGDITETSRLVSLDEDKILSVEDNISLLLTEIISKSIEKMQCDYEVDLINTNEYLRKFHPETWDKYKNRWDDIFPLVKFDIDSEVVIKKIGGIK
ncbi:MAG: Ger(x)C family spore germination protein, partial [Thermoanaerobacteraceae bacterium]|nr:Ger(x)C family spore germination protein [Thermoanaerobacteraceae bacterium]